MDLDPYTLFVRNLQRDVRSKDIERFFGKYSIRRINIRDSRTSNLAHCYVEFKHRSDARDAMFYLSGKEFRGERLRLDYKKFFENRRRVDHRGRPSSPRGPLTLDTYKYKLKIHGIPGDMTWRGLKSFLRLYCTSEFCDVAGEGMGLVAFSSRTDMDYAIRKLDNRRITYDSVRA